MINENAKDRKVFVVIHQVDEEPYELRGVFSSESKALAAYPKDLDPKQQYRLHIRAAHECWEIRDVVMDEKYEY